MKLFECAIRYDKTLDNGLQKKITEYYLVDALSFTEAETRITKQMQDFTGGEFEVVAEKITRYSEYLPAAAESEDGVALSLPQEAAEAKPARRAAAAAAQRALSSGRLGDRLGRRRRGASRRGQRRTGRREADSREF